MPLLLQLKVPEEKHSLQLMSTVFRLILVLSFFIFASPLFALGMSSQVPPSQYTQYRNQALKRTDPRLKHIPGSSKKANKCLQSAMGVCTMTEPENYGRLRYQNTHRKQDSLKKMGFQDMGYWSN